VTDAPYAVLAARSARGTIRFLNRDGWRWTIDEIAAPAVGVPVAVAAAQPAPAAPQAPSVAPAAPTAPPSGAPVVSSDEPYSPWDHFLFPQTRGPTIVGESGQPIRYGAAIGGGDRLGLQRWSIEAHAQPPTSNGPLHWGGEVSYLNAMAAPWTIVASAGFDGWTDPVELEGSDVTRDEERRTRDATLALSRTWRDTLTTTLAGVYTEDIGQLPDQPSVDRKLGGPALSLAWQSVEWTPYAGVRRALAAVASAAYYPHALSTFTGDIYDVGATMVGVAPLPGTTRHTLTLRLRGRALLAAEDTNLLQLGGLAEGPKLVTASSVATPTPTFDDTRFPPNLRFIEYLRGYEDYAITTDRAAGASLTWRYPLIIDRGVAATLWLFPASFVSQVDLELFATGAIDRRRDLHAAAGGELRLHIALLRLPFELGYQVARRVRDDNALTQLLELATRFDL